ncbi:MAG TPA: hypothetical protein EYG57_18405 [Planctomycetes bacterium]|jgi:hypothetical protein|nr:hypothetical protein [Verrucomicrobiales bacterium]HIM31506.1 hypothetical protein [Planctomycetota bacterium]
MKPVNEMQWIIGPLAAAGIIVPPLSEKSITNRSQPIDFPGFTKGNSLDENSGMSFGNHYLFE